MNPILIKPYEKIKYFKIFDIDKRYKIWRPTKKHLKAAPDVILVDTTCDQIKGFWEKKMTIIFYLTWFTIGMIVGGYLVLKALEE